MLSLTAACPCCCCSPEHPLPAINDLFFFKQTRITSCDACGHTVSRPERVSVLGMSLLDSGDNIDLARYLEDHFSPKSIAARCSSLEDLYVLRCWTELAQTADDLTVMAGA